MIALYVVGFLMVVISYSLPKAVPKHLKKLQEQAKLNAELEAKEANQKNSEEAKKNSKKKEVAAAAPNVEAEIDPAAQPRPASALAPAPTALLTSPKLDINTLNENESKEASGQPEGGADASVEGAEASTSTLELAEVRSLPTLPFHFSSPSPPFLLYIYHSFYFIGETA